jgi:restriction system protein
MAGERGRGPEARRRYEARRDAALAGGAFVAVLLVAFRADVWSYLLGIVVLGGIGFGAWWLWRTDRLARRQDRQWRDEDAPRAGHRSLAEVDAMSWQAFERHVAALCRRDGCTNVKVSGRSGEPGADVTATLPDGRRLLVRCKHYAPRRYVPSGDVRKFVGTARLHPEADVAVFAATSPFTKAALSLAARHDVLALHRDLLARWHTGTPLPTLLPHNAPGTGTGTGTAQGAPTHPPRHRETHGE